MFLQIPISRLEKIISILYSVVAGQMYGTKYVEDYRSDIKSLYNSGEADKKNKKSPAQMLEILESRYPKEFCLPSENDIRTKINKLQTQKKISGER